MKASDLIGMAVVSLQEGSRLGRVEQPLMDLAARQLGALQVKSGAGTFIIPFTGIDHIGSDAVTVASSQVTQTSTSGGVADGLLDLHALGKLNVVDQAGTLLGRLRDVEFDAESGQITMLSAHKGGMLGVGGTTAPIKADALLMVGADLITVSVETPAGVEPVR